jgi:undecaprenyl-diphosphatase
MSSEPPFPDTRTTRRLLMLAAPLLAVGVLLGHGPADAALLLAVNRLGDTLPWWWAQVTTLGLGAGVLVLGAILAALAGPRRERLSLALLWAVPFAGLLTYGAKAVVRLPRPVAGLADGQLHVIGHALTSHSGSMPSGHALAAATLAALWWLGATPRRTRRWLVAFALLVAASRVVVGAHWPSDVLVGAALGVVTAAIAWRLSDREGALWHPTLVQAAAVALPVLAGVWLLVGSHEQPQAETLRHVLATLGFTTAAANAFVLGRRLAWQRAPSDRRHA